MIGFRKENESESTKDSLKKLRSLLKKKDTKGALKLIQQTNIHESAIPMLESLGFIAEAAMVLQSIKRYDRAGKLLSRHGHHTTAAKVYIKGQRFLDAGCAARLGQKWPLAGDCFVKAGRLLPAAQCYVKAHMYLQAARCFAEVSSFDKSMRCYQEWYLDPKRTERYHEYLTNYDFQHISGHIRENKRHTQTLIKMLHGTAEIKNITLHFLKSGDYDYLSSLIKHYNSADIRKVTNYIQSDHQGSEFLASFLLSSGEFALAGRIYEKLGKLEQAAEAFEQAGSLKRAMALYTQLGNTIKSMELREKQLAQKPNSSTSETFSFSITSATYPLAEAMGFNFRSQQASSPHPQGHSSLSQMAERFTVSDLVKDHRPMAGYDVIPAPPSQPYNQAHPQPHQAAPQALASITTPQPSPPPQNPPNQVQPVNHVVSSASTQNPTSSPKAQAYSGVATEAPTSRAPTEEPSKTTHQDPSQAPSQTVDKSHQPPQPTPTKPPPPPSKFYLTPLFASLTRAECDQIFHHGTIKTLEPGTLLYQSSSVVAAGPFQKVGDNAPDTPDLCLLLSGAVVNPSNGEIHNTHPKMYYVNAMLTQGMMRSSSSTLKAQDTCEVFYLSLSNFFALAQSSGEVIIKIYQAYLSAIPAMQAYFTPGSQNTTTMALPISPSSSHTTSPLTVSYQTQQGTANHKLAPYAPPRDAQSPAA